jgi:hypothetical protein
MSWDGTGTSVAAADRLQPVHLPGHSPATLTETPWIDTKQERAERLLLRSSDNSVASAPH